MLTLGILLQLHDQVSGRLGGIQDRLNGLRSTSDKLIKIGTVAAGVEMATRPMSNAAQGLIADVARNAASLDDMSARIRSMPGITETAVDRLTNAGRAWARVHANSAEEFLDASYQMLSAGLNEAQALSATQVGLMVAKATMGNAAETANLLALSYNNFGDKARDSTKEITGLGDALTKTQQVFQISSMGQLAAGLQFATPAALGARMAFAEMNTVVGQLNSAGMQGSMAGTAFAATLREMDGASKKLGFTTRKNADGGLDFIGTLEAIKAKYGDLTRLSVEQKARFQKAFGDEGLRAVMLLSNKTQELRDNLKAVGESTGAAAEGQAKMESGAGQQWQVMTQNMRDLTLEFGTALLPALKAILPPLKEIVQAVGAFAKEHPGVATGVAALVGISAIVAPIASAVASIALLTGGLLKLAPVMAAFAAKAGAFAAFEAAPAIFSKLAGSILGVEKAFKFIMTIAKGHPILLAITLIATAALLIYKNWDRLKGWFTGFWDWLKAKAGAAAEWLKSLIPDWMLAFMKSDDGKKSAAQPRLAPALPSAARGSTQVGGEIHVKIDSEGRPRQVLAKTRNQAVPVRASVGHTMALP